MAKYMFDCRKCTNILRRMLDECGVEWGNIRNDGSESDYLTEWQFENNQGKAIAIEWAVGSGLSVEIHRYHLTPEQAIAATLGHAYEPPLAAHWDGDTLTLTIPRDPSCIRVQRSAEQPCKVYADDVPDGMLSVQANLTPAQAVEATLGSDLKAENDKLRKLVRGLEVCADEYADARTDCPLYDEGEPYKCAKERVMRELGIEADA